jgi:hypothetical protein
VARATPWLIDRSDLLAVLDRAAARKVTVISAPAGSGKTSLLRAWAGRPGQPRRLAVLQVQRDQQDAQQFWLALLDTVRQASFTTGRAGPSTATPDFNAPAMVDRVLSELAEARGGITLVIDDLAGELAEIRAADLRFPERETRELLAASGIALSKAGAALLYQRTEGWAAGLRLAAISLAGHPDPERFVAEFSGSERTVAEYLLAEMLDRQPPDVQELLRRTSLLDRVNGELADLLTGRPGSERVLLDLENANAFVESLDPELALVRAMGDLAQGRLDEAAAHLAAAEAYVRTAPPDRRRRLGVAVASLQLSLARRRGDLAGVIEQARFLASPVTGRSDEDIALGTDLRAVALMNLGTAEAWTLGRSDAPDAERHLGEGAVLAREIGRPYLEVACLAQLGFASLVLHSFATTQRRCREAIALAERYGWGAEPVIAPALVMLAGTMV